MGAVLILIVLAVVLGYFALVAFGVIGAAKKSADEAERSDGKPSGEQRRGRGFFGWRS